VTAPESTSAAPESTTTAEGDTVAPRNKHEQDDSRTVVTRRPRRGKLAAGGLLAPALLGLSISFVLPVLWMIRMAFNEGAGSGVVIETFTLTTILDPLTDSYYWGVIWNTFSMGFVSALLCIIVSYPLALFLARTLSRWKGILIAIALAPLLSSDVVRTYGWMVILAPDGILNSALLSLGIISEPLQLANSMPGVIIGLVQIFMPYAILAMISGFGRLNTQLEEAASSLGANRLTTFLRITFPLSLPGILTAFLLIFVLSISTFVTPRLLGGGRVQVLATAIYDQTTELLNWPFAAALAVILLLLFGTVVGLYQALTKKLEGE